MVRFSSAISALAFIAVLGACAPQGDSASKNADSNAPKSVATVTADYTVDRPYDGSAFAADKQTSKTLPEIAEELASGTLTSEGLTRAYLNRIDGIDRAGPRLQSVLSINPDALDQARASDARRAEGGALGPLDGVPILLKDNIETLDPLATTAGAVALKDNMTGRDSPLVAGLRAQGAVILGKTNLSQWANFRSNDSISGWSALGGQVRNPHMLDRSPCGSSSGSGAAIAASLAAGAVGTETNGSIICPSNVNGIVGFKPTVGVISQQFIIPISSSQDTAGPMTKTVRGAALMMDAMVSDGSSGYAEALDAGSLSGKRVGVLRFAQGSDTVAATFNKGLAAMEAAGATLVEIDDFDLSAENYGRDALSVLEYEFKHTLNDYLANTPRAVKTRSLGALIDFNKDTPAEMALFDQSLFDSSNARGDITDQTYLDARAAVQSATRENGIDKLLKDNNLDMLVSPSGPLSSRVDPVNGDTWPSWAGAGYLAAVAGYPHATVPMGLTRGVPLGFSIMGTAGDDKAILSYAYALEQATKLRADPAYARDAYDVEALRAALEPGR